MANLPGNNKILLIQAPPWGICAPPLGIAYLASFLKSSGIAVNILDLNIEIFHRAAVDIKNKWQTQDFEFWDSGKAMYRMYHQLEDFADRIISFDASIIGFSVTRPSAPFLNELLSMLRSKVGKNVIILLGGAGASYVEVRSLFRKDLVDYFIIGEGERALLCLLRDIRQGHSIGASQEYASWRDMPEDSVICVQDIKEDRMNINDIPFPTFDEFDLGLYTQQDLLPVISSRGCIRSCAFCCDATLKRPFRFRNPERVAQEIRYHVERRKRRRFEFSDLLINGDLGSLDGLCSRLIEMGLGISWGGQATVRKDMGISLFKKMREAGCDGIAFGCESFSDRVLKLMRKGITAQDAKGALTNAKEAGMLTEINIIAGFPGETEEDVDETIRFIRANPGLIDRISSLNICNIEPGMYLYDHLHEYNIEKWMIHDRHAWFNRDMSNTLEVRLERHRRLMTVCSDLGLKPIWQNAQR